MEDNKETPNENFISRWSKRKSKIKSNDIELEGVEELSQKSENFKEAEIETKEDDYKDLNDDELLEKFKLPNPEKIKKEKGLDVFFKEGVPDRLRQIALRRVWRLNPIIRFADAEINDYHEDFTDAATVVEGMQTAYQVGKGYLSELLENQDNESEIEEIDEVDNQRKESVSKKAKKNTLVTKEVENSDKVEDLDKKTEEIGKEQKKEVNINIQDEIDINPREREEVMIEESFQKPRPRMMTFTPKSN